MECSDCKWFVILVLFEFFVISCLVCKAALVRETVKDLKWWKEHLMDQRDHADRLITRLLNEKG
jgi:hypothetical protein